MTDRAPERLALGTALLVLVAVAALAAGASRSPAEGERAAAFHGLTGGLGHGTAGDPRTCAAALDPSVDPHCAFGTEPVPGAFLACPHHAGVSFRAGTTLRTAPDPDR